MKTQLNNMLIIRLSNLLACHIKCNLSLKQENEEHDY